MGLLDEQYVPETGQQVTGEKDKDVREGEAIQTSGQPHYNKVMMYGGVGGIGQLKIATKIGHFV